MDIQHLVDRLEQLLSESRQIPLTSNLVVDEDRVYSLIDQMRVSIPEEVKRANRIEAEKERILAQAHEEADRIRDLAKQEASELVNRDTVMSSAQQRADAIVQRARRESELMRNDADDYALDVLVKLEEDLLKTLSVVRNGMHHFEVEEAPNPESTESSSG